MHSYIQVRARALNLLGRVDTASLWKHTQTLVRVQLAGEWGDDADGEEEKEE